MANNILQIKRTSVSGRAANTTTLTNAGELALNMTDGIMYSTNGTVVFEIGANLTSIAVGNATNRFTANTTGAYHTGTVNATSLTVGSTFTANATLVNAAAINITGAVNTATLYATTSANIASAVQANSTGVFTTGTMNAASHTVGTTFTANATLVNAAAINIVGQVNTATFYAATSANIASGTLANSSGVFITAASGLTAPVHQTGAINATANNLYSNTSVLQLGNTTVKVDITPAAVNSASFTVGTSTVANSTGLFAPVHATAVINATANNLYANTSAIQLGNTSVKVDITPTTVNAAVHSVGTSFIANTTGAYHTGLVNAASFNTTGVVANTIGVYTTGTVNAATLSTTGVTINTIGVYTTGVVNGATISTTNFAANSTGVFHTGAVNAASLTVGTNFIANSTLTTHATNVLMGNDKQLRFQTINATAAAFFVQQSDDNFVFYTSNTAYGQRAVFSIFANSVTSNLQISVPLQINGGLVANGSLGTASQVLTSNGTSVYWGSAGAAGVNTAAQYTWTNTHTFSANVSFGNSIGIPTGNSTVTGGALYLGGLADANWKIGRNTLATTKWFYTNNTLDILAANSNLEGIVLGNPLANGTTYLETGHAGTYIAGNVTIGNTSSKSTINSTAFSGTANNATYFDTATWAAPKAIGGGTANSGTFTSVSAANITASANVTADILITTNNGAGTNLKVGDDAWIGDINTADTVAIRGQQSANNGYIVFGNADTTTKLGRAGLGALTYNGAFSVTGNVTVSTINSTSWGATITSNSTTAALTIGNSTVSTLIDGASVNAASHTVGTSFVANTSRVVIGTAVGLQANGGIGSAGQVLHSNGTTVYWATDDQGVTSVATANGLSGGPITSTGTLGVVTGSTLTVNTTGIHVNSALSITDLTLSGNLTVSGTTTYVNTTTLNVGDNIVTLNADVPGATAPTENSGIEVNRGSSANVQFIWDETNDRWSTNSQPLAISSLVAAGSASGITTLAAGNTTITGFANVTGNVQIAAINATSWGATITSNTTTAVLTIGNSSVSATVNSSWFSGTSANADLLDGQHGSFYTNATNITTGTLPFAQVPALYLGTTQIQSTSAAQAVSGITTLAAGNTTITGFVNATSTVNASGLAVGTSFIANTTGAYHTGVVNAATLSVGTTVVANSSGITGTLLTASQPNITGLGTLTSLSSNNTISIYYGANTNFSTGFNVYKRGNTTDPAGVISSSAELGYNAFYGYDGTAMGRGAYVLARSTEAWTSIAHGTSYAIATTPNGSTTNVERFTIGQDGNITAANSMFVAATINAASHTVGTSFTANSTLVNAAAINIVGQVNTATLYATTSANIASAVQANATGLWTTGTVNGSIVSVGTSFVANTTRVVIGTSTGLQANGSVGSAGQVLTSNGTTAYWATQSSGVNAQQNTYTYTLAANTTVISGADDAALTLNYSAGLESVFINGVRQISGIDYNTTNATAITLTANAVAGEVVQVVTWAGTVNSTNSAAQYTWTNTHTFSNTIITRDVIEQTNVSATAATGTVNIDLNSNAVIYFTANSTANWTFNFRANSTVAANTYLSNNQSVTTTILVTQGATAYYPSAHTIDGTAVTPKWQGGTAPTSGDASSIDAYTYTIIKTGAATYTVLAAATKYA